MKYFIRFFWLVLALVLVCTINTLSALAENDALYNPDDPIQVVDCTGRLMSFEGTVMTIATSQGGAVDNYFHALQVTDRIVATNGHHKLDKLFFNPDEMPLVGKWSVDIEALAKVNPDLYIGGINTDDLAKANTIGIRAYGADFTEFDMICYNLTTMGVMFGMEERAAFIVDYLNRIGTLIEERIATVPMEERPTAIMLSTKPGELSSKSGTMAETMMAKSGCVSVVPVEYTLMPDKPIVGLEMIFAWDPDVIFFQDYDCELNAEILYSDPMWQDTTAVKTNRVFEVPSSLDSWTKSDPAVYLGTLYMCTQLYPELFADINIKEYAVDFYQVVYGLDLTVDQIGIKD